ncbi:MAG: recombinase family protein [Hyphomicrobiaceae bacterium]
MHDQIGMTVQTKSKPTRCAIYTRVSTDAGLEQEFNSLQAQREACEAYVMSQKHEGWKLIRDRFDDGGFSGGNLDRPALQSLLDLVRASRVDVVVVYKVDRLTRSLGDFAKLVELFDGHGVSFVSVTQAFNTTSSMGRLTLNVLLSFAQFEREVTAERIRDKIAASKKRGLWMGGVVPLGYRVEARRLLVDQSEAETVQLIFERYRELKSLPALQRDLRSRGIVSRIRQLSSGRCIGGVPMANGPLMNILRNRTYLGEINHRGASYPGEHEAIVNNDLFDAVQAILDANRRGRRERWQASDALLLGKLFDDQGNRMTPSYAIKKGVRYRYYVSSVLVQGRKDEAGSVARIAAKTIEGHIEKAIASRLSDTDKHLAANQVARDAIRAMIDRVVLSATNISIELAQNGSNADGEAIRIHWTPPRQKRHREMLCSEHESSKRSLPVRRSMKGEVRARIILAIAKARLWLDQLLREEVEGIEALADREGRSERSIRMTLSLAFLAPDIVKAAVNGTLPPRLSLTELSNLPLDWAKQHAHLGIRSRT